MWVYLYVEIPTFPLRERTFYCCKSFVKKHTKINDHLRLNPYKKSLNTLSKSRGQSL